MGIILNSEQVGTWFDTVDMTIQYPDGTSDTIEHIGDAYLVKDVSEEILAAVRFSGEEQYRLFCSDATDEETFRKLLEEIHIQ